MILAVVYFPPRTVVWNGCRIAKETQILQQQVLERGNLPSPQSWKEHRQGESLLGSSCDFFCCSRTKGPSLTNSLQVSATSASGRFRIFELNGRPVEPASYETVINRTLQPSRFTFSTPLSLPLLTLTNMHISPQEAHHVAVLAGQGECAKLVTAVKALALREHESPADILIACKDDFQQTAAHIAAKSGQSSVWTLPSCPQPILIFKQSPSTHYPIFWMTMRKEQSISTWLTVFPGIGLSIQPCAMGIWMPSKPWSIMARTRPWRIALEMSLRIIQVTSSQRRYHELWRSIGLRWTNSGHNFVLRTLITL